MKENISGNKYNYVTVLRKYTEEYSRNSKYVCLCNCGKEFLCFGFSLKNGNTKSCGCYNSLVHKTHGGTKKPKYAIWHSMIQRCNNPNLKRYKDYGGRGIKVCDRWLKSFDNFYNDMGQRPDGLTIERRDKNGNYEPSNCFWETNANQQKNKRNNRYITFNNETRIFSDWCKILNINNSTLNLLLKSHDFSVIYNFYSSGKTGSIGRANYITYNGKEARMEEWSKILKCRSSSISAMLKNGKTFEQIFNYYTEKNKQLC